MKKIGGNIDLILKRKNGFEINDVGERIPKYEEYITLHGFLDMANNISNHSTYNAKVQDSSHYFICDYVEFPVFKDDSGVDRKAVANDLKAYCNGKEYDVLWVDNPMELNYHYEIYLEYKGA